MADTYLKFVELLRKLLPKGRAWRKEDGSRLSKLLTAMSKEFARVEERALQLIEEVDPRTAVECLEDWERVLDLPDRCIEDPDSLTIEQRQSACVSKIIGRGGQSLSYMEEVAAGLGYEVECSNYSAFRAGDSSAGDDLTNDDWTFWFEVLAPEEEASTATYFTAGSGAAGDPLVSWEQTPLECRLRNLAPAHTSPYFVYEA